MKKITLVALLGLFLLIQGCSTAPKRPQVQPPPHSPAAPSMPAIKDLNQLMADAALLPRAEQVALLVTLVNKLDRCDKRLVLAQQLKSDASMDQLRQLRLAQAECLVDQQHTEAANALAALIGPPQQPREYQLQARLLEQRQHFVAAAEAWLQGGVQEPARSERTWSLLARASDSQLANYPIQSDALRPYVQLSFILRRYAHQPEVLKQQLGLWQERFAGLWPHVPAPVKSLHVLAPLRPTHIAVLLPLSGRIAPQGQALQQGLLAAYYDKGQDIQLSFFDSGRADGVTLPETPVDFVIGPLLKERIHTWRGIFPEDIPFLALNLPDQPAPGDQGFYYALTPEDEAVQLAELLAEKGHTHPIVIHAKGSVYERMANRFVRAWQARSGQIVDTASFDNNPSMRTAVSELLDVAQSQERIRQIENLARPEVYSFSRNRRDVDAIVVFANMAQTEVLNPMIEASVAPFASILPVYGSSRSYGQQMAKNSLRDLRNLHFLDMPWMLPGNSSTLKPLADKLWPNRVDLSQRLFAMGYDALNLVERLQPMGLLPELRFRGLSGSLNVESGGIIRRRLSLGQVRQDGVVNLELE